MIPRRSFFGALAALAATPVGAMTREVRRRRWGTHLDAASMVKGEAGYDETGQAHADGKIITVYLDDTEMTNVAAASAVDGWVRRAKETPDGRIYCLPGTNEVACETLRGKVVITIATRGW